jgi:hypothetical protein
MKRGIDSVAADCQSRKGERTQSPEDVRFLGGSRRKKDHLSPRTDGRNNRVQAGSIPRDRDGSGIPVLISISPPSRALSRWTGISKFEITFRFLPFYFFSPPFILRKGTRLSRGVGVRQTRGQIQGRTSSCLAEERHEARINCQNTRQ